MRGVSAFRATKQGATARSSLENNLSPQLAAAASASAGTTSSPLHSAAQSSRACARPRSNAILCRNTSFGWRTPVVSTVNMNWSFTRRISRWSSKVGSLHMWKVQFSGRASTAWQSSACTKQPTVEGKRANPEAQSKLSRLPTNTSAPTRPVRSL